MTLVGANTELWSVFDARRVKAPELKGLDAMANGIIGTVKNHRPVLPRLKAQAKRIEAHPLLLELAAIEMGEPHPAECHRIACRSNTGKLAPVRASHRPPNDDRVIRDDQLIFRRAKVGKRGKERSNCLLDRCQVRVRSR